MSENSFVPMPRCAGPVRQVDGYVPCAVALMRYAAVAPMRGCADPVRRMDVLRRCAAPILRVTLMAYAVVP